MPVARAAAIVVHGCAAVHVEPLPLGDTNAPLTVSASGMQLVGAAAGHPRNPLLQANPHSLAAHVGDAFATVVLHTSPQLPQLLRSVVVFVHSVGLATGHAVSPALQSRAQAPAAHAACPVPLADGGGQSSRILRSWSRRAARRRTPSAPRWGTR